MKKLVALLLAVILLFSVPVGASAVTYPFKDIPAKASYAYAVEYVYTHELFNGTSATTFSPNQTMNRAMVVKVLSNLTSNYKESDWQKKNSFTDVKRGSWYAAPVAWASKAGLVNGIGGGKFAPTQNVTREQMAVFLYNYAKKTGNDTSFKDDALKYFWDRDQVSNYAKDAMKWAATHGVLNWDYVLKPKTPATRAEVAEFFANADGIFKKTVVDVEPGPDEPDPFSTEAYRTVIENIQKQQNALPSYMRFGKGFLYDLDGDSVNELVILHAVGYTHKAVSVYTIKNGKAVALMNAQKLYDEVSAPSGEVAVMTKSGKTYLGLFDQNGGMTESYGMRYSGKWVMYTLQNGALRQTNKAEFQQVERKPAWNTATVDGKSTTYAQYQNWVKGFAKKKSVVAPTGTSTGASDLAQLLKLI